MLVLTRTVGESIHIGDNIVVRILEIRGNTVRIGIDAPRTVAVHRSQVYRRIQEDHAVSNPQPD